MKSSIITAGIAGICLSVTLGLGVIAWKTSSSDQPAQKPLPDTSAEEKFRRPELLRTVERPATQWNRLTNDNLPSLDRVDLAREIDSDLTPSEIDLLFKSLRHQPESRNNENWWLVMNEIMEQLRRKGVAPERLGGEFISLVKDSKQPEVVRDYAVQHLSLWLAPVGKGALGEASGEARATGLEAIASTITDPSIAHTSVPGTAIMALTVADASLPADEMAAIWDRLNPAMTSMLNGDIRVPLATRTTIIQSLAMRDSSEHLPLVQQMARDESIAPSLRLSSIAALGIYQSEADRTYLSSLAQGNTRYRYAAKLALTKLP